MNKILGIILVLALLVVAGCGKASDTTTGDNVPGPGANEGSNPPPPSDTPITGGVTEVGQLDEELDTSDLDSLESDLEGIDW